MSAGSGAVLSCNYLKTGFGQKHQAEAFSAG